MRLDLCSREKRVYERLDRANALLSLMDCTVDHKASLVDAKESTSDPGLLETSVYTNFHQTVCCDFSVPQSENLGEEVLH